MNSLSPTTEQSGCFCAAGDVPETKVHRDGERWGRNSSRRWASGRRGRRNGRSMAPGRHLVAHAHSPLPRSCRTARPDVRPCYVLWAVQVKYRPLSPHIKSEVMSPYGYVSPCGSLFRLYALHMCQKGCRMSHF